MTRRQLLDEMDADEFMLWAAMEHVDPLPDPWLHAAMVCQTTANAFKVKGRPLPVDRWLPRRRKQRQDEETLKASFRRLVNR